MDYQLIIAGDIGWNVTRSDVQYQLSKLKDQHVDCKIASLGGSVYDALDIYQMFRDHGDVTVYFSGLCASAATIIAMGAKEVKMYDSSLILIHKCLGWVDAWGSFNSDDIDSLIADLRKQQKNQDTIDELVANIYAKKASREVKAIAGLMAENRWLSPTEAKDWNLVDAVLDAPEGNKTAPQNFVNYLKSQGMPVPQGYRFDKSECQQVADKDGNPAPSFIEKCASMLRDLFSCSSAKEDVITMQISDYQNINSTLGVEALEGTEDGVVSMSAEQLQGIEGELSARQTALDAANATIAQLQAQVDALKAAPGDETKEVEDADVDDISALDLFNLVKDY